MRTNRLHQLLNADPSEFAAAFGKASGRVSEAPPAQGLPLWIEGWVAPARTGHLVGQGEFIYQGHPRRFHFSVLSLAGAKHQHRRLHAAGTITRLTRLSQFNGTYLPDDSAHAQGAAGSPKRLRNENGVLIDLLHPDRIRPFSTPCGGLHVRL
jgi:hypothetical protein